MKHTHLCNAYKVCQIGYCFAITNYSQAIGGWLKLYLNLITMHMHGISTSVAKYASC